jgi:hypothetical protein
VRRFPKLSSPNLPTIAVYRPLPVQTRGRSLEALQCYSIIRLLCCLAEQEDHLRPGMRCRTRIRACRMPMHPSLVGPALQGQFSKRLAPLAPHLVTVAQVLARRHLIASLWRRQGSKVGSCWVSQTERRQLLEQMKLTSVPWPMLGQIPLHLPCITRLITPIRWLLHLLGSRLPILRL